jgi:hypothetical protein
MRGPLLVLLLASLVTARSSSQESALRGKAGLDSLEAWLTGSFSSAEQAARDTAFRDIRLRTLKIWRERGDGPWLYVEQAAAASLERPYRQRVYRLRALNDTTYESAVYLIPSPLRFARCWEHPDPLGAITPDSLIARTGCEIILRPRAGSAFVGSTLGSACPSELRGAAYATSTVLLSAGALVSWDRGFDSQGRQVWGATAGGYVFQRARGEP